MERGNLKSDIKKLVEKFTAYLEKGKKEIFLVSHFDTDGITSAAIMIQALKKLDKTFSVFKINSIIQKIEKNLFILGSYHFIHAKNKKYL